MALLLQYAIANLTTNFGIQQGGCIFLGGFSLF
jgi:hypothetical protein